MRYYIIVLIAGLAILFSTKSEKLPTQQIKENSGHLPNAWMTNQRVYPFDQFPKNYKKSAREYIEKHNSEVAIRSSRRWELIGPNNIGGRITDIELVDNDTNHILIGSASGGVFESTNSGKTWNPIFDDANSLSIGDIEIAKDSSNLIYVGTGEPNSGGGSITYDGDGIYKSIDGGKTWQNKGLETVGSIAKVVINPKDNNTVFAACMGPLFAKDSQRGIFRTKNGGDSWEQVLYISDSTGAIDLIINPNNPDTIYAAFWERTRTWNNVSYGGHTSGVFRSTDGGDTWTELKDGLPNQRFEKGRIGLALCHDEPNVLYAYYVKKDGNFRGIFKSTDYGEHWEEKTDPEFKGGNYYWWFGKVFVDPSNSQNVFLTGLNMRKSEDGGNTWNKIFTSAHVDHHTIYVHDSFSNWVLNGNDGGLNKSRNGGITNIKLSDLPISQFYTCEIDPIDPSLYYGGTQDNATMSGKVIDNWEIIYKGDGFYTLVDPIDNKIIYTEYQYGRLAKSTDKGKIFKFSTNGIKGADRTNWNTPVVFDPNNSKVMYYGANRLYRSKDAAQIWSEISPDLTNGPYFGSSSKGTITTISVSPVNSSVIYVGTDDGLVHYTSNSGNNWSLISDNLPNRWITRVTCDPHDEKTAYVCLSGYRHHDQISHIFKTVDHGLNWEDISGDLPDVPINDIIIHSRTDEVFIATDIGSFSTQNNDWEWVFLSEGMPNVVVNDIDIHEESNQLVAGTFGRSMYKMDVKRISTKKSHLKKHKISISPNPAINEINLQNGTVGLVDFDLKIINMNGDIVLENQNCKSSKINFNINAGFYIIIIQQNDKIIFTDKLIIQDI